MNILDKIVVNRRRLIEKEKESLSLEDLKEKVQQKLVSTSNFKKFIDLYEKDHPFLIAEVKKMSPSKGLIRKDFNLEQISKAYQQSSFVKAISVLTEPDFFGGAYQNIEIVKRFTDKPILMKDFVVDEYQIYQGFLNGASAVLFIATLLDDQQVASLKKITRVLKMEILFEVHSLEEYQRAIDLGMNIIGINNRDLKSFKTNISTTLEIIKAKGKSSGTLLISESGLNNKDDLKKLLEAKVDGFLIGESFMKEGNVFLAIENLLGA